MNKYFATLILALIIAISGCSGASKSNNKMDIDSLKSNEVIIKVDGDPITKEQFDVSFDKLYLTSPFGKSKVDLSKDKNYHLRLLFRSKAVNDLIIRQFLSKEANKLGITVSDKEIQDVIGNISAKVGGAEKFQDQLSVTGLTMKQFKNSLKSDIIAKKVVDKLSENLTISDEEAKKYYEENKEEKFNTPESARISHIFIKADPRIIENNIRAENKDISQAKIENIKAQEMEKRKQIALSILNSVKANPSSFETVAKEKSDDKMTAVKGGDMGYFPKGLMLTALDKVVFDPQKARVGEIYGELVQTTIGFHIIKLVDHRKKGIVPFDTIRLDLKSKLIDAKKIEILNDFIEKRKAKANIEYLYKGFDQNYINEEISSNPNKPSSQATKDIKQQNKEKQS